MTPMALRLRIASLTAFIVVLVAVALIAQRATPSAPSSSSPADATARIVVSAQALSAAGQEPAFVVGDRAGIEQLLTQLGLGRIPEVLSQASGGAFSFGGAVPAEFGTAISAGIRRALHIRTGRAIRPAFRRSPC